MELKINELSSLAMEKAKFRWNDIAIPLGSLGKLEEIIVKCAGIFETDDFDFNKKAAVVMCADNGIVAQNVTQTGQEVTKIVAENLTSNKATMAILCKKNNADLFVVDIGMSSDSENVKIINKKIMHGTHDFSVEKAMSREEVVSAIEVGIDMVKSLKKSGYSLLATGEMGIGNTSTSSAIISSILQKEASLVTGRGAGLSSVGLNKKIELINQAIAMHKPDLNDMIDVLSKVGGLDIAGLVGVFLGAAMYRVPVLIDGFISGTAALVATKIEPKAKNFMFASHISAEPAGKMLLEELGVEAMLELNMRLGEGTGAAMAFNIFEMANTIYREMSNFDEINVEKYVPLA